MIKDNAKKIILFSLIIAALVYARTSGVADHLTFDNLQRHRQLLHQYVGEHYALSVFLYIISYIAVVAFSIPGGTVLTLAGGFMFGVLQGSLYVNMGATTGATLAFLSARYLIGDRLQQRYASQLQKFNSEIDRNGHLYLLTLRFVPLFPFFMINFLSGLTKVPLRTFVWTTAAGIIPGSLVYAFAGSRLNVIHSPKDILSMKVLAAFLMLGLFALLPVIFRKGLPKGKEARQ